MASNILQNYEQVSGATSLLTMHRAKAVQVIGDTVATRTLTIKEAGCTALFDSAAGVVYTLPVPVAGAVFEFVSTVTITSNAAKVITDSANTFIIGAVVGASIATASPGGFAFDGSTHRAISMNGTTTGGVVGTTIKLKALSTTVWQIEGVTIGSGTLATPAATS